MDFLKWPSIPRLSKETMTVTEKIDGTNSAIRIRPFDETVDNSEAIGEIFLGEGPVYTVWVQSRNRFISPGKSTDNAGFAGWVNDNLDQLVTVLGPGDHYGEWWGSGVQRGYNQKDKHFSLFNARRWLELLHTIEPYEGLNLHTVPLLYTGQYDGAKVQELRQNLIDNGTTLTKNFRAEGMVVELREIGAKYKVLCENDEVHKWQLK